MRRILHPSCTFFENHFQFQLLNIAENGSRASEVITRIRALLKKSVPEKARLDINEVIGGVLALTKPEAARQHIQVHLELGEHLPAVLGDKIELQQGVLNLISNGMEAMAPPRRTSSRPARPSMRPASSSTCACRE